MGEAYRLAVLAGQDQAVVIEVELGKDILFQQVGGNRLDQGRLPGTSFAKSRLTSADRCSGRCDTSTSSANQQAPNARPRPETDYKGGGRFSPAGRRHFSRPPRLFSHPAGRLRRHDGRQLPHVLGEVRHSGCAAKAAKRTDNGATLPRPRSAARYWHSARPCRPAAIPAEVDPRPRLDVVLLTHVGRRIEPLQAAEVGMPCTRSMAAAICRTYCRFRPCPPLGNSKYLASPSSSHSGTLGTTPCR